MLPSLPKFPESFNLFSSQAPLSNREGDTNTKTELSRESDIFEKNEKEDDILVEGIEERYTYQMSSQEITHEFRWSQIIEPMESYFLSGEQIMINLKTCKFRTYYDRIIDGKLIMTSYRLIFEPMNDTQLNTHFEFCTHLPPTYYQIPLTTIDKIEKIREQNFSDKYIFMIYCRDVRFWKIQIEQDEVDRVENALKTFVFPNDLQYIFCFSYCLELFQRRQIDILQEFERQGVLKNRDNSPSPWKLTDSNKEYLICGSYPEEIIIPASFDDTELSKVGAFRAGNRFPVLTWGSATSGASIWRSSQPKFGVGIKIAKSDIDLLYQIALNGNLKKIPNDKKKLYIIDCRPKSSAIANKAAGYGFEESTFYPFVEISFMNIYNIHSMKDSFNKLTSICVSSKVNDFEFNSLVEGTKWLTFIRLLLQASFRTAKCIVAKRVPVLVHCSHGWDRTSQVVSLAQLLIDPFFRTIKGFEVLIEKDWLKFGHPFQLRHAIGQSKETRNEEQMSPIFLQFLDCTWQLLNQFPYHFEFNSRFLLFLADHVFSSRFGNFIFNNDRERLIAQIPSTTCSIWAFVEQNKSHFTSFYYKLHEQKEILNHDCLNQILLPPLPCLLRNVTLWGDYFLRFSPKPLFSQLEIYSNRNTLKNPEEEAISSDLKIPYELCRSDYNEKLLSSLFALAPVKINESNQIKLIPQEEEEEEVSNNTNELQINIETTQQQI